MRLSISNREASLALTELVASTASFTFRFTSDNASQVFFNGAEVVGASPR
jgi:hypothetical protein